MMDVAAQPAAVEGGWWERAAGLAQPLGVWLYGFLVVALTAGSAGGYLPTTHGWTAVITLWLAAVTLMVRDRVEVSTPAVVLLGALAAFTAWMTLSAAFWSPSPTSAMHEVQRNLAYLGIVAAGLALTSRRLAPLLAGGVLAGVVLQCLYALGTRVLPDRLGAFDSEAFGYRLSLPITYWNGLGIFAVMGMLLALGFAARARSTGARAAAAAALPLLATANYFTFSRGAWIALAVGLVVALVIDARRLQLIAYVLVLAPWTVVAVHAASNREALTTRDATLAAATDEGHSLLPLLLALACASGAAAAAFAFAERRIEIPRAVRAAFAAVVAAALLGGAALFTERHGPPWEVADRMWTSFTGAPTKTGPDLSERIFQLSNNGRLDLWTTSWESFERDRALGSGAGTFWQQWAANGDRTFNTTEGHSLYAETLGELGIPGLVLVVLLVAMPLVAGVRARRTAFVPAVTGAFAAWVAHAGVDWDWELVGVTGVALLCGTALVSAVEPARRVPAAARMAAAVAVGLLALAALPLLVGNQALATGREEISRAPARALERASDAARWAPWSTEPDELRGDAWRALGERERARDAYLKALEREPGDWTLWGDLADASTGEERLSALRRAAALNPRVVVEP